jgi:hypothetical protein
MMAGGGTLVIPGVLMVVKVGFVIFAVLYFVFSLVIIRQVSLMAETVKTELGGVLKILSIAFALFSLAILIYFLKTL